MRLLIAPGLKPEPLLLTPDGEPIPTAPGAARDAVAGSVGMLTRPAPGTANTSGLTDNKVSNVPCIWFVS